MIILYAGSAAPAIPWATFTSAIITDTLISGLMTASNAFPVPVQNLPAAAAMAWTAYPSFISNCFKIYFSALRPVYLID
jgi:hypothetical protein